MSHVMCHMSYVLNWFHSNVRDAEDAAEDKIVTGKTKSSKITSDKISSSRCSWHSSMESFVSAVASKEDLAPFDETDSSPRIAKPLLSSALASLYGEHLRRSTCKNWKVVTPYELSRRCSLQTNLKVILSDLRFEFTRCVARLMRRRTRSELHVKYEM